MAKIRLDIMLHNRGLASSREKAKAMILAGEVIVNGQRIDKSGTGVSEDAVIELKSHGCPYVSRGGLKLEKALQDFSVDFAGKTVLDVGASTGGYTDCALQHGAKKVFAIDVGYGQLDWKLRNDQRVVNFEKTNIRYFNPEQLGEKVDIITIDVSFISTALVFPVVSAIVKNDGLIISLVKPQFEAGREQIGKKGVVRDAGVHCQVIEKCIDYARRENLYCVGITYSPIKGPQGNIEYFILLQKNEKSDIDIHKTVNIVVDEAHHRLGG